MSGPPLPLQIHALRLGLGRAYLLEYPQGMILVDCGSIRQELRVTRTMQQRYAQDWPSIPASQARTQALHPQWIYPGHGDSPLPGVELQNLRVH